MVQFSSMAWHSGIRKGAQFVSHTVRRFVRLFFHPIWGYSPSQILRAVQRDWDGPVGTSARAILAKMVEENTRVMIITFSEKDEPFLEMECTARVPKPNDGGKQSDD